MPRTKGAKNREKSDEQLIEILKKRGYAIDKQGNTQSVVNNDGGNVQVNVKKPDGTAKKNSESVSIKVPHKTNRTASKPGAQKTGSITYKCGNKLCNYTMTEPHEICPNCGARLTWD